MDVTAKILITVASVVLVAGGIWFDRKTDEELDREFKIRRRYRKGK